MTNLSASHDTSNGKPVVRRSALKRAYIGNFLDLGWRPRKKLFTISDVASYLRRAALSDLGGKPIDGPDPKTDERIARTMAAEIIAGINRSGGKSAMNWYTDSIERMIGVAALLHPEVEDDAIAASIPGAGFKDSEDAKTVLFCAMAITSQNIPVSENMGYAVEQFRHFLTCGRFDPRGYGVRGSSVKGNLERFNLLLDVCEGDISKMREFLSTKFMMSDLRDAGKKVGLVVGTTELNDEIVYGSMIFGPKIGNGFYQNLVGNYAPITLDLWFMRTWGRYTGTIIKDFVSDEQMDRLRESLATVGAEFPPLFKAAKVAKAVASVDSLDKPALLALCNELVLIWERYRRAHVERTGDDNVTVARLKAEIVWPSAALAVRDALSAPVDAPTSAGQRKWIRNVVRRSLEILLENGYDIPAATAQAILWYPERSLYEFLVEGKVKNSKNLSYDEALVEIARKEGHDEHEIEQACLHSLERGRHRGQRLPGPARPGDAGSDQGILLGADEAGRIAPAGRASNRRDEELTASHAAFAL